MPTHALSLLAHLYRLAAPAASDATLLARWLQQRDDNAFAALMARHGPMVLGVCRRVLGEVQTAEDVFQATFLILARQASRVRQPEALAGFLYTIARRLARKARRRRRRNDSGKLPPNCPKQSIRGRIRSMYSAGVNCWTRWMRKWRVCRRGIVCHCCCACCKAARLRRRRGPWDGASARCAVAWHAGASSYASDWRGGVWVCPWGSSPCCRRWRCPRVCWPRRFVISPLLRPPSQPWPPAGLRP